MKVVVTGAAGQLGTLMLSRLIADPEIKEVVCVDLRPPRLASAKIRSWRVDVRSQELSTVFAGAQVVIHLAFVVADYLPARQYFDINVEGSKNVFRQAANASVSQVIYASSITAYGLFPDHPEPIVESTPRRLQTDLQYAAAKYWVEEHLDHFEHEHPQMRIARLRPAVLIGNDMNHIFGHALKRRVVFKVNEFPIPIVWDEDVADAVMLALHHNAHGAFNLATEDPLTAAEMENVAGLRVMRPPRRLLQMFASLSRLFGRFGFFRVMDPAWFTMNGARMIISSERAVRELGWQRRCLTGADVIQHYVASLDESRVLETVG